MDKKEIRIKALELAVQLDLHSAMREGYSLYSSSDIVNVAKKFENYITNDGRE